MKWTFSRRSLGLSCIAASVFTQINFAFAQEPPKCGRGVSYAETSAGVFFLIEDEPGSPNSSGRLELVTEGQTVWSAATWRGCSNGISICNLVMPYTLDDGTTGSIDFDMSFGRVRTESGEEVCVTVMSQMGERLGYLHKRHYDTTVRFDQGRPSVPGLEMRDFLQSVPSVYQSCVCGNLNS
jgi:hypothetical protein